MACFFGSHLFLYVRNIIRINYEKDYISTLTEKGTGNDETIFRGLVCESVLKVVVIFEICEQKQY